MGMPLRRPAAERVKVLGFDATYWDPLYLAARDVSDMAWVGVRGKLVEALGILRDLLGHPEFTPDDLPIAAITYAIVKESVARTGLARDRRAELCQMIASNLYYRAPEEFRVEPNEHWWSLLRLANEYPAVSPAEFRKNKYMVMVGRLLASYGLSGEDHLDIRFGIYQNLVPCTEAIADRLRGER